LGFPASGNVKGERKVVTELNQVPCHEDVWGSDYVVPRILEL